MGIRTILSGRHLRSILFARQSLRQDSAPSRRNRVQPMRQDTARRNSLIQVQPFKTSNVSMRLQCNFPFQVGVRITPSQDRFDIRRKSELPRSGAGFSPAESHHRHRRRSVARHSPLGLLHNESHWRHLCKHDWSLAVGYHLHLLPSDEHLFDRNWGTEGRRRTSLHQSCSYATPNLSKHLEAFWPNQASKEPGSRMFGLKDAVKDCGDAPASARRKRPK